MQPKPNLIKIKDNTTKIKKLLSELVLEPRKRAISWSHVTKQTPNIKIGYPGQHLSSLITGMEGERTGARGNDLTDGSEVKSCSRIDQLDKCKSCSAAVARMETACSQCNSSDITRNNDSKWLFGIRNQDELDLLVNRIERVVLVIADYANFDSADYETLRFQSFEIWPQNPRQARFSEIMSNYYNKIYLEHKKKNPNKTPAPKNFWPYTYQFYICNPILTFQCIVHNANKNPRIKINHYVKPSTNRLNLGSETMPVNILTADELDKIINKATKKELASDLKPSLRNMKLSELKQMSLKKKQACFSGINEELRKYLPLRDTDKISTAKKKYTRRVFSP